MPSRCMCCWGRAMCERFNKRPPNVHKLLALSQARTDKRVCRAEHHARFVCALNHVGGMYNAAKRAAVPLHAEGLLREASNHTLCCKHAQELLHIVTTGGVRQLQGAFAVLVRARWIDAHVVHKPLNNIFAIKSRRYVNGFSPVAILEVYQPCLNIVSDLCTCLQLCQAHMSINLIDPFLPFALRFLEAE